MPCRPGDSGVERDGWNVRTIEQATLHLPCKWHDYPEVVTATVFEVHDYGRAIPRGLIVHEGEVWIASRGGRGSEHWKLETKVCDVVVHQRGGNFVKWRNYLRRIVRWPWKDEDTKEILGAADDSNKEDNKNGND